MKSIFSDERGAIPIIEVALLVVVLAVAGYAGYTYFQRKSSVSSAPSPVPHAAKSASPSAAPAAASYFVISQWGGQGAVHRI
jgi:hypothetical protein